MRFLLIALGLIVGCGPPDHSALQAVMMEERLDDRLSKFIANEKEKCRTELMAEASLLADSLLRATNPILIQIDSIKKPPKPIKPAQPDFERPQDSMEIAPIIPKENLGKDQ